MARTFCFALVPRTATTFSSAYARQDENVFSFSVSQGEGDFCSLSVTIEKPSQSLLDPVRPQWAWLSMNEDSVVTPLFFGRVIGIPAEIQADLVTIEFLAKPADFDNAKRTRAAALKLAPYWDDAFIDPQMADDPDTVMEARTEVWDIDRVTHQLTNTSIIQGEDGTIALTGADIPFDGFSLSYTEAPLRKVQIEMRAMWTQQMYGTIDVTPNLLATFEAAGSPAGFVTSYTGTGLYDDWPREDDAIGNVYSFGPQVIEVADGKALKIRYKVVSCQYARSSTDPAQKPDNLKVYFRRWGFRIESQVKYEVEIDRTEDIRFNVIADIQDIVNDADDQPAEVITLSSGNIGVPVGPSKEIPIGDVRRDSYFNSVRGARSIEYGLAHARALLMRRARAVEIRLTVPFDVAVLANCRKSVSVVHPGLPGETAIGKIVAYEFGVDGSDGAAFGSITIACMAGKNTSVITNPGNPTWVSAGYVGADYQVFQGRTMTALDDSVSYQPPHAPLAEPVVIGVKSCAVQFGEDAQGDVLSKGYVDIDAACDALNAKYTKIDLKMIPVDTEPRSNTYDTSSVTLAIGQGIDLGAA